MNREQIEGWREVWKRAYSFETTIPEFRNARELLQELCDLALRGLEAGEPTNREKIYGPLLDKIAGEPVAYVWDEAAYPAGDVRGRGWREVMGRQHPHNPAMTRNVVPLYAAPEVKP